MTKLNKVEGSIENCPSCKQKIYCRTKQASGNFPAKLQWQDEDGKAHYSFDFATKLTSCKSETKTEPKTSNQNPFLDEKVVWDILQTEEYTDDMKELVLGLKTMRSLAYQDAKDVHPEMSENSNTFGQIVNAGISHLINLAKVKALRTKK